MQNTAANISLGVIGQIAINVKDLARATSFYRDTLGMKFLFEFPGLSFFDANGIRLMLSKPEKPELDHPSSILYYRVTDIIGTHEAFVARGVEVEEGPRLIAPMPDHDLWISGYRDSERNFFCLMSEVPRAG